jgi:hypothetical protein
VQEEERRLLGLLAWPPQKSWALTVRVKIPASSVQEDGRLLRRVLSLLRELRSPPQAARRSTDLVKTPASTAQEAGRLERRAPSRLPFSAKAAVAGPKVTAAAMVIPMSFFIWSTP